MQLLGCVVGLDLGFVDLADVLELVECGERLGPSQHPIGLCLDRGLGDRSLGGFVCRQKAGVVGCLGRHLEALDRAVERIIELLGRLMLERCGGLPRLDQLGLERHIGMACIELLEGVELAGRRGILGHILQPRGKHLVAIRPQQLLLEAGRLRLKPLLIGQVGRHLSVHRGSRAGRSLFERDAQLLPAFQHRDDGGAAVEMERWPRSFAHRINAAILEPADLAGSGIERGHDLLGLDILAVLLVGLRSGPRGYVVRSRADHCGGVVVRDGQCALRAGQPAHDLRGGLALHQPLPQRSLDLLLLARSHALPPFAHHSPLKRLRQHHRAEHLGRGQLILQLDRHRRVEAGHREIGLGLGQLQHLGLEHPLVGRAVFVVHDLAQPRGDRRQPLRCPRSSVKADLLGLDQPCRNLAQKLLFGLYKLFDDFLGYTSPILLDVDLVPYGAV